MPSIKIYGLKLDGAGRCQHYHTDRDVVALKCAVCQRYYACYQCHDALADHTFAPVATNDLAPVLCGVCRRTLTYQQYQLGHCPYCGHAFNPGCQLHHDIYFRD